MSYIPYIGCENHPKTTQTRISQIAHTHIQSFYLLSHCSNQLIRGFRFLSMLIRLAETWKIENVSYAHITHPWTWREYSDIGNTQINAYVCIQRDAQTIVSKFLNEITGLQFHIANRFSIASSILRGDLMTANDVFTLKKPHSHTQTYISMGFPMDRQMIIAVDDEYTILV